MQYAQIDKVTGKVLNLIAVANGYNFPENYDWQPCDNYRVQIGDYYINDKFYYRDKTTVIEADLPIEVQLRKTRDELEAENEQLRQENIDLSLAVAEQAEAADVQDTENKLAIAELAESINPV